MRNIGLIPNWVYYKELCWEIAMDSLKFLDSVPKRRLKIVFLRPNLLNEDFTYNSQFSNMKTHIEKCNDSNQYFNRPIEFEISHYDLHEYFRLSYD